MALDAARLSAAMLAAWQADPDSGLSDPLSAPQLASITAMCDAFAGAIVGEITGHAVTSTGGAQSGSDTLTGTVG